MHMGAVVVGVEDVEDDGGTLSVTVSTGICSSDPDTTFRYCISSKHCGKFIERK